MCDSLQLARGRHRAAAVTVTFEMSDTGGGTRRGGRTSRDSEATCRVYLSFAHFVLYY